MKIIKIESCSDCPEYSYHEYDLPYCMKSERGIIYNDNPFPDWCPLEDAPEPKVYKDIDRYADKSDWREVHELFLEIGEDLMSIGTHSIMSEDWYAMVEKKIDHGITLAYRKKQGDPPDAGKE